MAWRSMTLPLVFGVVGCVGLSVLPACGSAKNNSGFDGGAGGNGDDTSGNDDSSSDDTSTGFGDQDAAGGGFGDGTDSGITTIGTSNCGASVTKGKQKPLDIYLMLDESASMLGPKWNGVTGAIKAFVAQPNVAGISIGIQYFGISCNVSDYATPAVEIAPLPGVANAIIQSLPPLPATTTPTVWALEGAIQHATDWAKAHPKDLTVVVLATDGEPLAACASADGAQNTVQGVADVAQKGVTGSPSIPTYVIGVGNDLASLNAIAVGGGTKQAILVDSGGANTQQQFIDAMNAIRGQAVGCQFKIPIANDGGAADPTKVNVEVQTGSTKTELKNVASKAKCPATGDAWYYDDPTTPTEILLCDTTCGTVSKNVAAQVNVLTGCKTQSIQ